MEFLTSIFKIKQSCTHQHITPDMEWGYCPDCGKLIQNEWYIVRCRTCGVKLVAVSRNGIIVPKYNFCTNCGSHEFVVEELEKINFIDINFAVLVKNEIEESKIYTTTSCYSENATQAPKLLVQF